MESKASRSPDELHLKRNEVQTRQTLPTWTDLKRTVHEGRRMYIDQLTTLSYQDLRELRLTSHLGRQTKPPKPCSADNRDISESQPEESLGIRRKKDERRMETHHKLNDHCLSNFAIDQLMKLVCKLPRLPTAWTATRVKLFTDLDDPRLKARTIRKKKGHNLKACKAT